ncbi:MAG: radical SAM protein [Bacteroidales bacterium]|nr:radical SAM protein [Bacteroidales bacterium]
MSGFLFHDVIFGPVRSRRLGLSLGINLLPLHKKLCSFNCIYCECGWTPAFVPSASEFPDRTQVARFLEQKLKQLVAEEYLPDSLTYAGNGEPTLHPEFSGIVDDTIELRNKYAPDTKVTVLSNSSMIHHPKVFAALNKLDNNILKLDAGSEKMLSLINQPVTPLVFKKLISGLKMFNGNLIIQSMFLKGTVDGQIIDNTTQEEVLQWLNLLSEIRPKMVMVYPVARETPVHSIEKISDEVLQEIAERVRAAGLNVSVYH